MKHDVSVLAVGMVSSVGLLTPHLAAAVRAGISRIQEVEDWQDLDNNLYRGGFLPQETLERIPLADDDLDEESLAARLLRLGSLALAQLEERLEALGAFPPLYLGLSCEEQLAAVAAGPGGAASSKEAFLQHLQRQAQYPFDPEGSEVLVSGRAAGLLAIHRACMRLSEGFAGPIIAGGLDSYHDLDRLEALEEQGRILTESNLDGFLPGEGAGFLLLSGEVPADGETRGRILSTSIGFEPGHLQPKEPLRGDGLSQTLQDLLSDIPPAHLPCPTIYVNASGESLDLKQWGVSLIRCKQLFAEDVEVLHPADCLGETGAAMGPILVGLATEGMCRGYRPGPFLVGCLADEGLRVALFLGSRTGGGG